MTHYADPRAKNDDIPRCHVCGRDALQVNLDRDLTFPSHWSQRDICEECAAARELGRADTVPPGEVL